VELRVDGTLNKGEFRVQAVWDETESGHTQVTPRLDQTLGLSMSGAPADVTEALPNDTVSEGTEGEQTVVRPRHTVLYQIEVWQNGVRESVIPVVKNEITIGRGSRSITVDLPIKGDPEVSRVHATLTRDVGGRYWLVAKGRNPTMINGQEIPRGENVEVAPDQKIGICNFVLRIQP
jgi:hypothetical protein